MKNLNMDQIKNDYKNGISLEKLGIKYGCSHNTIRNRLISTGVSIRTSGEHRKLVLPENDVINEYKSGVSIKELTIKYMCCFNSISKILKQNNCNISSRGGHNKLILPDTNIVNDYKNMSSIKELSKKYNCSSPVITNVLKTHGCKIRKGGIHIKNIEVTDNQLINDYELGLTSNEIGKKYGYSQGNISQKLKNLGYPFKHKTGKESHMWKDGLSFLPYCEKFNEEFKEKIRNKFNRKCYICNVSEKEYQNQSRDAGIQVHKLSVHHVNYDKNCLCNDSECEFVPMCRKCHAKTNSNRKYWENFIMNKLTGGV